MASVPRAKRTGGHASATREAIALDVWRRLIAEVAGAALRAEGQVCTCAVARHELDDYEVMRTGNDRWSKTLPAYTTEICAPRQRSDIFACHI